MAATVRSLSSLLLGVCAVVRVFVCLDLSLIALCVCLGQDTCADADSDAVDGPAASVPQLQRSLSTIGSGVTTAANVD